MNKRQQLFALAQKRKLNPWPGYHCLGDYHSGAYECDHVSPYTKSAGNVDAKLFVLLQDWTSDKSMRGPFNKESADLGLTRNLPTNKRLLDLLKAHFGKELELSDIYATNLFPFIKSGGISSYIPLKDLVRAATEFGLPQIDIIEPKIVICLGLSTFNAIRLACGLKDLYPMSKAIDSSFTHNMSRIWCQAHTGAWGQNKRGREQVDQDWHMMKQDFLS